jgi:SAM-dependent methyltransferase
MTEAWREANRANWDERVDIHLRAYDLAPLRAGRGRLTPMEEAELGEVAGQRVLHLQCHIGSDTLVLAQRGAEVTGLDFSAPAIAAARTLAAELGLPARFVVSDLYAAPDSLPEPHGFDLVYVTWGALCWLPDIAAWARVVAYFLRPGGALYLAEGHPAALVFDDECALPDGLPGYFLPYFHQGPLIQDDTSDYADPDARLQSTRTYQYIHPLGGVVSALLAAGLTLEFLHEHDAVPWRMFAALEEDAGGVYRWPDRPWLPLAFSLRARAPQ